MSLQVRKPMTKIMYKHDIKTVAASKNGTINIILRDSRVFIEFGFYGSLAFMQIDISDIWSQIAEFIRHNKSKPTLSSEQEKHAE
jgi:hypothetical protein